MSLSESTEYLLNLTFSLNKSKQIKSNFQYELSVEMMYSSTPQNKLCKQKLSNLSDK